MPIPFYKDTGGSVTVTYFLEQTTTFDHPESNPEGKLRKEGVASQLSEGRDGGQGGNWSQGIQRRFLPFMSRGKVSQFCTPFYLMPWNKDYSLTWAEYLVLDGGTDRDSWGRQRRKEGRTCN